LLVHGVCQVERDISAGQAFFKRFRIEQISKYGGRVPWDRALDTTGVARHTPYLSEIKRNGFDE